LIVRFPLGDRLEQGVGPAEQGTAVIDIIAAGAGRINGQEFPLAMLTHHPAAQVFHPDLQAPAASGAFLHEVYGVRHGYSSCSLPTRPDPCRPVLWVIIWRGVKRTEEKSGGEAVK
jgi:hypothetical protein